MEKTSNEIEKQVEVLSEENRELRRLLAKLVFRSSKLENELRECHQFLEDIQKDVNDAVSTLEKSLNE
jgi:chaperonin cofactor prefoldin